MTPEELATLMLLRKARDMIDREYAQPWGPKDRAFRDPPGNTVRVAQA